MKKKHIRMLLSIAGALIGGCSIMVHPYGDVKRRTSNAALMNDAIVGPAVKKIVENSCKNCHSETTEWPWYSYVAPMSWLIEGDVYDARRHMNLSRWDEYGIDKRQVLLSEIALMVRNRKMPPPRYLALHPEAKLSDTDIDQIYQWAREKARQKKSRVDSGPGSLPSEW